MQNPLYKTLLQHRVEDEIVEDLKSDPGFLCPKWSQYTIDTSVLELQAAVALSVGINPAHRYAGIGWARAQGHRTTGEQASKIQAFIKRFDFVSASVGDKASLLRIAIDHQDPARAKVRLVDFVAWTHAQSAGWDWPEKSPLQKVATPDSETQQILSATDNTTQGVDVEVGGASGGDCKAWPSMARDRAAEIIKRDGARDLYPNQVDIADEIAREFRRGGVVGEDGKPLKGSYIKRHALKGISSAQGKQLSTSIRPGK